MDDLIRHVLERNQGDVLASVKEIGDHDLNPYYAHHDDYKVKSGSLGSVDIVIQAGEIYARKSIPFKDPEPTSFFGTYIPGYNRSDFENEVRMQEEASEIGLAPEIHQVWVSNTQNTGTIIMDALLPPDWTSVQSYTDSKTDIKDVSGVFEELIEPVSRLYDEIGVIHGDLHLNNIFYNRKEGKYMFIDFGRATKVEQSSKKVVIARALKAFWKDWSGENYEWIRYPLEMPDLSQIHPDDRDDVRAIYDHTQRILSF